MLKVSTPKANLTVESVTAEIFHEKISSKSVRPKKFMTRYPTAKTVRLKSPTAMGLILNHLPERLTLRSSMATI